MKGNVWDFGKILKLQKEIAFKFLLEFNFSNKKEPLKINIMEESMQIFSETAKTKEGLEFEIFYKFQLKGKDAVAIKSIHSERYVNVTNRTIDTEIRKEGNDFVIDNEPVIYLGVSARSMNCLYREKRFDSFIMALKKFAVEAEQEFQKDILFHNPFKNGCLSLDEEGDFEKMHTGLFYPNTIRFKRKLIKERNADISVKIKEINKVNL